MASPGSACFEHFIAATERYVNGVAKEIEDRTHNRVRPLEEFIRLRRDTAAARSVLGLCEFGLNLPNEVIEHPIMSALTLDAVDLTFICNVSCFHRVNRSERTLILSKKLPRAGCALIHPRILLWVRGSQLYHDHHDRVSSGSARRFQLARDIQ